MCIYYTYRERERDREIFPQRGSILEKKKLDTLAGTLCCVGRGFGCAGRAGLGWAGGLARWAGLGADSAISVYGLHCTCLLHVFTMSLCLSSCISQMCIMGLEQKKAWHW